MTPNPFDKFPQKLPPALSRMDGYVKFEIKPYLQPFERVLALRELHALLGEGDVREHQGYYVAPIPQNVSLQHLKDRLTFWQRVGVFDLDITQQLKFELSQASTGECGSLHKTRRLRYGLHHIHEYRGKFYPQLVRSLINISNINQGAVVLDPMCGSGTTLCESMVLGMSAIGADINPLSLLISEVKSQLSLSNPDVLKAEITNFIHHFTPSPVDPNSFWDDRDLKYLRLWFAEEALADLAAIISHIDQSKLTNIHKKLLFTGLSNVIRSLSWQKETDLRARKEVKPYAANQAQGSFVQEVTAQLDRVISYLAATPTKPSSSLKIQRGDSTQIDSIFSEYRGKVDLLITSPPYATALPYLETDRLSLVVLKLLNRQQHSNEEKRMIGTREISERERGLLWGAYLSRKSELPIAVSDFIDLIASINHQDGIGVRRKNLPALLAKYFLSMMDAMKSAHKLMKPNARAYYIVGNNSTELNGVKTEIPTDDFLFLIGEQAGWKSIEKISMELLPSRDIFKKNKGSTETILIFES